MQDLAAIIRSAISAAKKTQRELADSSGVPQQRISAFLAGGSLRLEHASRLAHALGLTLARRKR